MIGQRSLSVIVPAYCEADNIIGHLLESIGEAIAA